MQNEIKIKRVSRRNMDKFFSGNLNAVKKLRHFERLPQEGETIFVRHLGCNVTFGKPVFLV